MAKIKVMCFGTFDNIHKGHIFYLKQAQKLGDYLIAVVARDENVFKIKKKLPQRKERVRVNDVKKTNIADKVVLGNRKDKIKIVKKEKPDIIALGYDQEANEELLKKFGFNRIIRINSFHPSVYKSSKLNNYVHRNS